MGRLTVDCGRCAVSISGAFVALTRNEYTIVELLSRAEGRVITNECMLSALWGSTDSKRHCQLRVHIYNIRHKLAIPQNSPGYICTINGIGYRMDL